MILHYARRKTDGEHFWLKLIPDLASSPDIRLALAGAMFRLVEATIAEAKAIVRSCWAQLAPCLLLPVWTANEVVLTARDRAAYRIAGS